jgi:tetratricopeptide (TPR) repeat protein
MSKKLLINTCFSILFILILLLKPVYAQFEIIKRSDRIMTLVDTMSGERQDVILSRKGMVVLNSFWSGITAEKFKKEWIKQLKRDDFIYNINTVDRLDLFGGNSVYRDITIIGHESFLSKFKQPQVDAEIKQLIEMWRWKEDVSRKRLPTHESGSEAEKGEKRWLQTCKNRADELEDGFSLVLPNKVYKDKMILDLGDLNMHLLYFGKAGYDGMTLVLVPEEETVFIPGFIFHSQHLAPGVNYSMNTLDVPRWIKVLNHVLNEHPIKTVICGMGEVWTRERALVHLNYIEKLWHRVTVLEKEGNNLQAIQEICSLEDEFSFVKELQTYKDHGDDWTRPQHKEHVQGFFLQHKKLASKMIRKEAEKTSLKSAITKIYKMKEKDKSLYFDESSFNAYGYELMNTGKTEEAIMVFQLNFKMFPESANVYDSLGEAYMKNGQKDLAIKNYEKSLELNPENSNAREMLTKLGGK